MNTFILENDFIQIQINEKGAELRSVFYKQNKIEILYSGKENFWNRSAPVLFPIVGKLKENSYKYQNQTYQLPQHGFARDLNFKCISQEENSISLKLKHSEETLINYPFKFELTLTYSLDKYKVTTNYQVKNIDSKELLFSIGAHPGFTCPIFENETFEDYFLEFEQEESFKRNLLNLESGTLNGSSEVLQTKNNQIKLAYSLFEKDAIVFKYLNSRRINLKNKKTSYNLEFEFNNFPFFGIWTKKNAPFICLEPWCGIADSENHSGNLEDKEGIIKLLPNEIFNRSFSFKLIV